MLVRLYCACWWCSRWGRDRHSARRDALGGRRAGREAQQFRVPRTAAPRYITRARMGTLVHRVHQPPQPPNGGSTTSADPQRDHEKPIRATAPTTSCRGGRSCTSPPTTSLGRITTRHVQPFIERRSRGRRAGGTGDIWISDFNTHSIWRYNIPNDVSPVPIPNLGPPASPSIRTGSSVVRSGRPLPRAGLIGPQPPGRHDVQRRGPADQHRNRGAVWFTEVHAAGRGRLDPATGRSTVFAVDGGPEEIAPAPAARCGSPAPQGKHRRISPDGAITAQSRP